jgi:hypothetical protein
LSIAEALKRSEIITKEKRKTKMNTMNDLITYSITDASIAAMRENYLALRVNGLDDKAGYALCKSARLEVKAKKS